MRYEMSIVHGPPEIENPTRSPKIERRVRRIIDAVRARGDDAVREFASELDGFTSDRFEASPGRVDALAAKVDSNVAKAMRTAHGRIVRFARAQKKMFEEIACEFEGHAASLAFVPVERVLCYVPGGRAPLPSTALMTVAPARVAGVREIAATTPRLTPEIAFAVKLAGAHRAFELGGAHAIAAFAFGTKSIPKVDMIVGPGGAYVTEAKRQLFGTVGIDMLAGPSEVCIVADDSANPALVAADLLAQAEHDPLSIPILLTPSESLADEVRREVARIASELNPEEHAARALKNGGIFILPSIDDCLSEAERLASEHVELFVRNPRRYARRLKNYGALFIGERSAEVFGDYAGGTNHVLPTGATARFLSGLWVGTFMLARYKLDVSDARGLIEAAASIAEAEGLTAHRAAALARKSTKGKAGG